MMIKHCKCVNCKFGHIVKVEHIDKIKYRCKCDDSPKYGNEFGFSDEIRCDYFKDILAKG